MRRGHELLVLVLLSTLLVQPPTGRATYPGTLAFQSTWGGISTDIAFSIVTDPSGYLYITGQTYSFTPPGGHVFLLKYDLNGGLIWQREWMGNASGTELGHGIGLDSAGNVYVTGTTSSFGGGYTHVFLLKFNSTGDLLWQRLWTPGQSVRALAVAVDSQGYSYVTGGTSSPNMFVLKFNSTGGLVWQIILTGRSGWGWGIAVNSSGTGIYATGMVASIGPTGEGLALLSFDKDGNLLWQKSWPGGGEGDAVVTDAAGNIYMAGSILSYRAGYYDTYIAKFDETGHETWAKTWGGVDNDWSRGVALDANGNLYVTGITEGTTSGVGSFDVFLLRLNTDGDLISQITWGGSSSDEGFGVATNSVGDAFVTGFVYEGPPYKLGSLNDTLGVPSASSTTPSLSLNMTSYPEIVSNGTTIAIAGSRNYSGSSDAFLFEYCPTCSGLPSSPLNPRANPSAESVTLTWQAPSLDGGSPITGYNIYRGTTSGGESSIPLVTLGNLTSYFDSGATAGVSYFYEVTAVNGKGEGPPSNEVQATPQPSTRPSPPQNLTSHSGINQISLTWLPPVSNGGRSITGYRIYRGIGSARLTFFVSTGNTTKYNDTTANLRDTGYFYEVSAFNGIGESEFSFETYAKPFTSPASPSILIAFPRSQNISLSWNVPTSDGGLPITSYEVLRSTTAGEETNLATIGNVRAWIDTSAMPNTVYYYEIVAINDAGTSPPSNEVNATLLNALTSWQYALFTNLPILAVLGAVAIFASVSWRALRLRTYRRKPTQAMEDRVHHLSIGGRFQRVSSLNQTRFAGRFGVGIPMLTS